jgi:hypothetical protein
MPSFKVESEISCFAAGLMKTRHQLAFMLGP